MLVRIEGSLVSGDPGSCAVARADSYWRDHGATMTTRRRVLTCLVAVGLFVSVLALVQSTPTAAAAAETRSGPTLVIANSASLSDIGTAVSLVAAGEGDAVVLADGTQLGAPAAALVANTDPDRVILVGGTAALMSGVETDIARLAHQAEIERFAGSTRIETAALAARRVLKNDTKPTFVIANGWSLSDVGTAASAVAAGIADAVLFAGRDELGQATERLLSEYQPAEVVLVGGPAAIGSTTEARITHLSALTRMRRLGGQTRTETAARLAQEAFEAGADFAVMADGWSLEHVGVAAALAAALKGGVVLYTTHGTIGAKTTSTIAEHRPASISLIGQSDSWFDSVAGQLESHVPNAEIDRVGGNDYLSTAADATLLALPRASVIAARYLHSCALDERFEITCWGADNSGQSSPPEGKFVDLAVDMQHSCGLRSNGRAVCWGLDPGRTLGAQSDNLIEVPEGTFTDIASGNVNACGIRTSGEAHCWGIGQVALEAQLYASTPLTDSARNAYFEISNGNVEGCKIRQDRYAECRAREVPSGKDRITQVLPPPDGDAGKFSRISIGDYHTCAIREDRSVVCWGLNYRDYLSYSGQFTLREGMLEAPAGQFVKITAGFNHSCGLHADGTAECWGDQGSPRGAAHAPSRRFVAVSAGSGASCAIEADQSLMCWGGEYGTGSSPVDGSFSRVSVSVRSLSACAVRTSGEKICWITRSGIAHPSGLFDTAPVSVQEFYAQAALDNPAPAPITGVVVIDAGSDIACAVLENGSVMCWNEIDGWQSQPRSGPYEAVSASGEYVCALTTDRNAECFDARHLEGPPITRAGPFSEISHGRYYACGIRSTGAIECWANEDSGISADEYYESGLDRPPAGSFTKLATSSSLACAIRTDGTVACWGDPFSEHAVPMPEGTYIDIAVASHTACGLRSNGEAVCWGDGFLPHADVLAEAGHSGAVRVPEGAFDSITVGLAHACALRETGRVECWSGSAYGLANPRGVIPPDATFAAISATSQYTCGLRPDDEVTCW